MHGTQGFVLARYGPAGLGYNPMEARHVKSFQDGSDGFAAYFTGVKWPNLFPANFTNECFSFQPLDSGLKFVNDYNATTRKIVSALYPGTEDEPDLYLPFPAGYIGPGHPDYLDPNVICHLCEAPVPPASCDEHVSECNLYDSGMNDGFGPVPASPRDHPKFAPGSGALEATQNNKGKETPRQTQRREFGSILNILVSENDNAYEAFRRLHKIYVAERTGSSNPRDTERLEVPRFQVS